MTGEGKRRLLVVDDSRSIVLLLKKTLEGTPYEIVGHAQSGEDAVTKYEELKPDLVTMDLILPGMNGIETIKQIVAKDPAARIIVMSSVGSVPQKLTEALEAGARNVITKPFEPTKVLAAFEKALKA